MLGRTTTLGGDTVLPTLGSLWAGNIVDTLGSFAWMQQHDTTSFKYEIAASVVVIFYYRGWFPRSLLIYFGRWLYFF